MHLFTISPRAIQSKVRALSIAALVVVAACVAPRDDNKTLACAANAQCPANGKWYCDTEKKECVLCQGACPGTEATPTADTTTDAGTTDTTTATDTGAVDTSSTTDGATTDTGTMDTVTEDTGIEDTGTPDTGADVGATDTGPAVETCKDWCGKSDPAPGTSCYCDTTCLTWDDCCPDFKQLCPSQANPDADSTEDTADATSAPADATTTSN